MGSVPGSRRSPEEGNGNPLQYSCLGNPMDRGSWRVTVHGVTKESDMTERTHTLLSDLQMSTLLFTEALYVLFIHVLFCF